jgi:hypothetical protein
MLWSTTDHVSCSGRQAVEETCIRGQNNVNTPYRIHAYQTNGQARPRVAEAIETTWSWQGEN